MSTFIALCEIDVERKQKISVLNTRHLTYIKNARNLIYGGIVLDEVNNYKKICYVISAESISEAENFVKGDPYFEIYLKYEVNAFLQKFPV